MKFGFFYSYLRIVFSLSAIMLLSITPGSGADLAAVSSSAGKVSVQEDTILVETKTFTATILKGALISLCSKLTGEEYIESVAADKEPVLQLVYPMGEVVAIDERKFGSVETYQVSRISAEIVFHCWDGDGVVFVGIEPETGDMLITPSAYSSRPGVRACRWLISGIKNDLLLVAPLYQGVCLTLDDPLIRDSHWPWPMHWEAGLAVLQSKQGGFWVHTRDNRYRYKALKIGDRDRIHVLGFDSEAYGPIDENLSGGGLCWRINVFKGEWQIPAAQYRDWLWQAYNLNKEEERRPDWLNDLKLAISWCPADTAVLDALAAKVPPAKVLLHIPNWRTDAYDENYPDYHASGKGTKFIKKGQKMGFHMMPHFNAVDMDPSNPAYSLVQDFQYRDLESKRILGWSWFHGNILGVPESNTSRLMHRDKKVMVKVHPGLAMWRSILGRNILSAIQDLNLDVVFIDVTLTNWNLHNCFVESTTSSEGMRLLIDHISRLGNGVVVGGEGLNEITMQGLSLAQAHLFKSHQRSIEGLERTGGCPLNTFLFGKLCRTIGYSNLDGKTDEQILRMRIHQEHGAIPTLTIDSADDIVKPTAVVSKILLQAGK
jgi:hypothetical protein